MTKQPVVYILASRRNGTLYIGVTSDLVKRMWEHRNDVVEGFTKCYGIHRLVYCELHGDMSQAIRREKQMKKWNRAWKVELIERGNPEWVDLWSTVAGIRDDASESGNRDCFNRDSRLRGNDGKAGGAS